MYSHVLDVIIDIFLVDRALASSTSAIIATSSVFSVVVVPPVSSVVAVVAVLTTAGGFSIINVAAFLFSTIIAATGLRSVDVSARCPPVATQH